MNNYAARWAGPLLLSVRGGTLALIASVILLWPMTLVTAPLAYFDTAAYERAGKVALNLLLPVPPPGDGGAGTEDGGEDARGSIRSAAWSVFVAALGGLPWGAVAACALQTAMTLFVFGALVPTGAVVRGRHALLGATTVGAASGLPWYASYAMPDILGALVVTYYAALTVAPRRAPLICGILATFAILSHYGHLPLAGALAAFVLIWRVRRLSVALVVAALAPLLVALAVNAATGLALGRIAPPPAAQAGEASDLALPSIAPQRLPILLARSIEDGLALPYLTEACAANTYRSCAFLVDMPDSVGAFLWSSAGIKRLDAAEMAVLRSDEIRIVTSAALARPLLQAEAILRHTGQQLLRTGIDEILPLPPVGADGGSSPILSADAAAFPVIAWADRWVPLVTLLAALGLALRLGGGWLHPALVGPAFIILAGLLVNAAIFGGLSYPVDRYQGRLAWLVPALLALDLALAPKTRAAGRRGQAGFAGGRAKRAGIV